MHLRSGVVWLALGLAGLSACDAVYQHRGGEFHAGPVDPVSFPPDYLGNAGTANRQRSGAGRFVQNTALVNGAKVGVFYFSAPAAQLTSKTPLRVRENGAPVAALPTPRAYVFTPGCEAPEGYTYDPVVDDVRYDEQGDVLTGLPEANYNPGVDLYTSAGLANWRYAPVVARVPVTPTGTGCQDIKSERTLVQSSGVAVELQELQKGAKYALGMPDGTFLARAVIDPGAGVYKAFNSDPAKAVPAGGVGLQKWGWFNQFLLAYLDGGEIPTRQVEARDASGATVVHTELVTQKVYYPLKLQDPKDPSKAIDGALTGAYAVMQFRRGEPGYSPICEVVTYDTGTPMKAADLPKDWATIEDTYRVAGKLSAPVKGVGQKSPVGDKYVYCLQLE